MPKAAPLGPTRQCAMFCYLPRVENGDSRNFSTGIQGGTGICVQGSTFNQDLTGTDFFYWLRVKRGPNKFSIRVCGFRGRGRGRGRGRLTPGTRLVTTLDQDLTDPPALTLPSFCPIEEASAAGWRRSFLGQDRGACKLKAYSALPLEAG